MGEFMVTKEQADFFDVFGFIKFPALMKDEIGWITEEFEKVFPMFEMSGKHDGTRRTMIVPFIDQREKLAGLLDDPRIEAICTALLGENFNYMGSDGNYYSGVTGWHRDGEVLERRHIKIAFYLDSLHADTGALRVIPGSHRLQDNFGEDLKRGLAGSMAKSVQTWNVEGVNIPAVALDVEPGDILVFDHNTFHSAWGGGTHRRMFTMNLSERYADEHIETLRRDTVNHSHYRRESYYGGKMIETAGPQRLKHLEQVLSQDYDYAERVAHLEPLK